MAPAAPNAPRKPGELLGGGAVLGDQHPLARRETVRLDHDPLGSARELGNNVLQRRRLVGERLPAGGGDAVLEHELLGEILAALQTRRGRAGTEDRDAAVPQHIGDARAERGLGTDHDEPDVRLFHEVGEFIRLFDADGDALRVRGYAGVAGGAVKSVDRGALPEFPHESVFAAARTDHQYIHLL